MSNPNHIGSHQIGSKAGMQIVKEAEAAGLDQVDMAIACETAVAIVIAAVVMLDQRSDPVRHATELVNLLTERAHGRVTALLLGVPYEG